MMDLGATNTYTAGIISTYAEKIQNDTSNTEEPYDWGKSIIEKAQKGEYQYVDLIMAGGEQYYRKYAAIRNGYVVNHMAETPYSVRTGLFTAGAGIVWPYGGSGYCYPTGAAKATQTFRPVFWN